jgi:hypothetical protein
MIRKMNKFINSEKETSTQIKLLKRDNNENFGQTSTVNPVYNSHPWDLKIVVVRLG